MLSTQKVAIVRLIAQIIRLRDQFPNYQIQFIRLDHARKFLSKFFYNYCMSFDINKEYLIVCTRTPNSITESFIKLLNLII